MADAPGPRRGRQPRGGTREGGAPDRQGHHRPAPAPRAARDPVSRSPVPTSSELARVAAEGGAKIVAALGGDGTVSLAANGLLGTGAAFAALPAGTGDDFAKAIGAGKLDARGRAARRPEDRRPRRRSRSRPGRRSRQLHQHRRRRLRLGGERDRERHDGQARGDGHLRRRAAEDTLEVRAGGVPHPAGRRADGDGRDAGRGRQRLAGRGRDEGPAATRRCRWAAGRVHRRGDVEARVPPSVPARVPRHAHDPPEGPHAHGHAGAGRGEPARARVRGRRAGGLAAGRSSRSCRPRCPSWSGRTRRAVR